MAGANWSDLRTRIASALVMVLVAGLAVFAGGWVFLVFVALCVTAMIWELAWMVGYGQTPALGLAALAAASFLGATVLAPPMVLPLSAIPAMALILARAQPLRAQAGLYALAVMLAGLALLQLRAIGVTPLLWLLLVVVGSDVAGYFAGRALGGPKFWPAISPKKTWSGTIAGWVAAVLVGAGFAIWAGAPWAILALSPLVALAGQLGDILESWFKRRTGVKDSSALIPGHGGFLDRFDALLTAALLVMLLGLMLEVPLPKGL